MIKRRYRGDRTIAIVTLQDKYILLNLDARTFYADLEAFQESSDMDLIWQYENVNYRARNRIKSAVKLLNKNMAVDLEGLLG